MRAARAAGLDRQVADEGEALAVEAARRERQQRASSRPGRATTRIPAACAAATSRAPGIGDRRQAGLGDQADVVAVERRREQRERSSGAAASGRPFGGRGSSTIAICCSGCASGQTASTRFRNARVVLRVLAHPVAEPRGDAQHAERQTLARGRRRLPRCRRRARSAPGRACPRASWPAGRRLAERIDAGARAAARRCGSAAGRSAPSGRRIRRSRRRAMPSVSILALPAQS